MPRIPLPRRCAIIDAPLGVAVVPRIAAGNQASSTVAAAFAWTPSEFRYEAPLAFPTNHYRLDGIQLCRPVPKPERGLTPSCRRSGYSCPCLASYALCKTAPFVLGSTKTRFLRAARPGGRGSNAFGAHP